LAIPSRVEESLVDTIEGLQQAKTSRLEIKRKVSVFQVGKEFYVAIDQYAKQKEGVIKQVQESSSSNNSHSSSSAASNDSKNEKLEDAPQAMNCIAVVDASSSMSGPRIKIVEKALLACLQDPGLLSTWSRMGIVLFDQRAHE
jgi:Mg-chelatase subunit ChlD